MLLQLEYILLEGAHLFLVAQHLDDVAPRHDAQFGVQCLDELHIGVVHAIEDDGVYVFEYNQFFYHSCNSNSAIFRKGNERFAYFVRSMCIFCVSVCTKRYFALSLCVVYSIV